MVANKTIAIIPVRMESSRLPNKPLALINGKPLVLWVWEHASRASIFSSVMVATDSKEIAQVCKNAGAGVIMTSETPRNGSERVYQALENSGLSCDIVFNVQGDMPFIQPEVINRVGQAFSDRLSDFDMATLTHEITDVGEYSSSSCVKLVFDNNYKALYFSRSAIPNYRDGIPTGLDNNIIAYKHVGLYAFKPSSLKQVVDLPPSKLENAENLEQLRALENGFKILTVPVERALAGPSIEVDTPTDLEKANEISKTYLMPG